MNGGAWLRIDGQDVDLHYRDRADVKRWTTEADEGRWELFRMPGYLCGMASYVLVGEAAVGRVLAGTLDRPGFPSRLARDGPQKWIWEARFWLQHAAAHADAGDIAACIGKCSSAIVAVAQARLLQRSEWALNEKGIVVRAGLADVEALLLRRTDVRGLVDEVGRALDLF
jgi:hypothetical protein